jgi:ABC-type lipoprotein release transport system permease subunit
VAVSGLPLPHVNCTILCDRQNLQTYLFICYLIIVVIAIIMSVIQVFENQYPILDANACMMKLLLINPVPPQITPIFVLGDIANVWLLSVVLSVIAGLYPAWKASGLSPVLALKR